MQLTSRQLALYLDHIATIKAGELLDQSLAASFPHMTEDGRDEIVHELQEQAGPEEAGDEVERISFDEFKREIKRKVF